MAVIGSGYMGGGIAQVLALSGARVLIADVSAEIARAPIGPAIIDESRDFVAAGLFPAGATETWRPTSTPRRRSSTRCATPPSSRRRSPRSSRSSTSHPQPHRAAARPDAIIGSNTSTISIATLAEAVDNPDRFLGVHFSNPAPFIPGVELIPHAGTDEAMLPTVEKIVAATGKQSARVTDITGFVLNRLQYALFHEATQLVEEGVATADDIDTIVRTTFGFRLPFFGPFAIADMAGLDVYAFCYASLQTAFPERFATPQVLHDLVDDGMLGTKSGAGFLDVPAERLPELIAYRNKAYVAMQKLISELGPAPIH